MKEEQKIGSSHSNRTTEIKEGDSGKPTRKQEQPRSEKSVKKRTEEHNLEEKQFFH
jgi:hypothetical protein